MKKVLILGSSGMLGSMMLDVLSKDSSLDLTATVRDKKSLIKLSKRYPLVKFKIFNAESDSLDNLWKRSRYKKWIINAIGIIKPYIKDGSKEDIERALHINAIFPYQLARHAEKTNSFILQIATDCVFSGSKGNLCEQDLHDATDVYGKTKSLGEVKSNYFYNIRCSIIGPEMQTENSLLEWLLKQPKGQIVKGFTNHRWNGLTTLHFAKLCLGIIKEQASLPTIQHVVPSDTLSKADLLQIIAKEFKRGDLKIERIKADQTINRVLTTVDKETNKKFWILMGYNKPISVAQMIKELAEYGYNS